MHIRAAGDQKGQTALSNGAPADHDDLPAGQTQSDKVGALGHPASLVVTASAAGSRAQRVATIKSRGDRQRGGEPGAAGRHHQIPW
ncbi:hypothetical protein MMRN_19330 [Mycobacterium marinum]|nr:hypothetical protein MMRN_19330 [Mycobacterium marinum]